MAKPDEFKTLEKLDDLKHHSRNANKGTKRGNEVVTSSIEQFGLSRSIVADRNGVVGMGNKTLAAAKKTGRAKKILVVPVDGDTLLVAQRNDMDFENDPESIAAAIADNRAGELNIAWDVEELAKLEKEQLAKIGFPIDDLRKLGMAVGQIVAPEPRFDKADALQKKWKTARGQLWRIKDHRLICGDSTSAADVAALFATGKKAWLLATDPPYGVGYGVSSGPDSAKRFDAIGGDEKRDVDLQKFLESVFKNALPYLNSGCAWYLWHAQMTQGFFAAAAAAAAAAQVRIHRQIIWAKSHFILGHGDYHWQHELCFYGWRDKEKHRWFGDRCQSTIWNIQNPRAHENHPTEKPIECFAKPMQFNTQPGDVCYEPFSGSGSQIVAADKMERICYAMEIEPGYVAVALERLSEMGLSPELDK